MLVLSRKVGESICIAGDIVVTVSRIEGNRVSLALAAPREVHIMRQELKPFVDEFRSTPPLPVGKPARAPLASHLRGRTTMATAPPPAATLSTATASTVSTE